MRRGLVIFGALAALCGAAPAAQAGTTEICQDFVKAKGKRWGHQGTSVSCAFQHDSLKAFLRDGVQPKGYKCTRVKTRGVCTQKREPHAVFIFYVKGKIKG
jgi:hypothetical protein